MTDPLQCRVCDLVQPEPPWGADGHSPTFDICARCGTEFGYEDCTPAGVAAARARWLDRARRTHIWLDDLRPAPEGWTWVKTASEAIALLQEGGVVRVSLDHDLGDDPAAGSGYDVACFVEAEAFHGRLARLAWTIHSANPVGVERMRRALENADRTWET